MSWDVGSLGEDGIGNLVDLLINGRLGDGDVSDLGLNPLIGVLAECYNKRTKILLFELSGLSGSGGEKGKPRASVFSWAAVGLLALRLAVAREVTAAMANRSMATSATSLRGSCWSTTAFPCFIANCSNTNKKNHDDEKEKENFERRHVHRGQQWQS